MKSIFSVFKRGLKKTSTSFSRSITGIFTGAKRWGEAEYEELEAALIAADFGVNISLRIVDDIRERYALGEIGTSEAIIKIAQDEISGILRRHIRPLNFAASDLTVIMMVGVNGSGKTTSIGKLAHLWTQDGKKVMLGACDTFRAAAVEQLKLWGDRTGCQVISSFQGADPSAVAYDAVEAARARAADILLLDTAGRQHTSRNLMQELEKMRRTVAKVYPDAPHEVWLTVDASVGGNALIQAREFLKSAGITGLVLTKLDGTGKGGMAAAIQEEYELPVFFAGLGEQPGDLQPFDPDFYSEAIFGKSGEEN